VLELEREGEGRRGKKREGEGRREEAGRSGKEREEGKKGKERRRSWIIKGLAVFNAEARRRGDAELPRNTHV